MRDALLGVKSLGALVGLCEALWAVHDAVARGDAGGPLPPVAIGPAGKSGRLARSGGEEGEGGGEGLSGEEGGEEGGGGGGGGGEGLSGGEGGGDESDGEEGVRVDGERGCRSECGGPGATPSSSETCLSADASPASPGCKRPRPGPMVSRDACRSALSKAEDAAPEAQRDGRMGGGAGRSRTRTVAFWRRGVIVFETRDWQSA